MHPTDDQIKRYFNRQCTAEEAEQVYQYLTQHPEVVERFLSYDEWLAFTTGTHPDGKKSADMLAAILSKINVEPKRQPVKLWRYISIAATICVFIGLMVFQLTRPQPQGQPYVVSKTHVINWQNATNHGNRVQHIKLDDGSDVALSPGSSVRYKLPFKNKSRDIYLTGVARFKVAKDKARPFTVFSGEVATTALGTVFTITAWPAEKITRVKLHSGKVRVINTTNGFEPQYLLPGKELVYNKTTGSINVQIFNEQQLPVTKPAATIAGTIKLTGDTLRFVNQPLPDVFNKLQQLYGDSINIKADLKKYRFTGDFNIAADSLPVVLSTISTLNKLQVIKTDSSYTISPIKVNKKK
ncbi:FecR family protein [Mucilaginibacter sp. UR6-1]|uniref:FecR family protein n=1 Tax=Mucilaginibacter sp. UR6-1 TaxID=1435643 RepID=UPI001E452BE6|nr:FecR family protein [Mucilaginibacter sp. UR6-1]MCC8409311.1 FecR family protein [Mucilaginibacter sp. UR6-1]